MLDFPEVKLIRRSDLISSPTTPSLDADKQAELHAQLDALYGPAILSNSAPENALEEDVDAETAGEEVFEFRLFQSTTEDQVGAHSISLRDKDDGSGDGGFVALTDPRKFIVERAVGERKAQFEDMALSGEMVQSLAARRAWGLEIPWRVRVIHTGGANNNAVKPKSESIAEDMDVEEGSRKRPGKKRRIILRSRKKAKDELAERRRREFEAKEGADKEKRTRKNREKKVKRRLKEKAKKSLNEGDIPKDHSNDTITSTVDG